MKSIYTFIDWKFLARLLLIFIPLYYINLFFWGITDPANHYSPFIDKHLNYIAAITSSILHASNVFNHIIGLPSVVNGNLIYVQNGAALQMEAACVGLNIMSFWVAYVLTGNTGFKHKLLWCATGIASIWLINCARVSVLLYSLQNNLDFTRYVNAHDMFNYAAYAIILVLIMVVKNYVSLQMYVCSKYKN